MKRIYLAFAFMGIALCGCTEFMDVAEEEYGYRHPAQYWRSQETVYAPDMSNFIYDSGSHVYCAGSGPSAHCDILR